MASTLSAAPALVNREQAAAYLGLRPQTLAAWQHAKRYGLPVIKCGRSVRYRLSDLENWLASRTVRHSDE